MTKKNNNEFIQNRNKSLRSLAALIKKTFTGISDKDAKETVECIVVVRQHTIIGLAKDKCEGYLFETFGDLNDDSVSFEYDSDVDLGLLFSCDMLNCKDFAFKAEPIDKWEQGDVTDFIIETMATMAAQAMLEWGRKVEALDLMHTGICPDCREKLKQAKN